MEYLKFGDTEIAVPTTFTIDKKKIMSDNAGLSSTCKYVGDVKGLQTTLHIEWANLQPQEVAIINEYVLNVQDADFPVTYLDETFNMVTARFRTEGTTYEQWGWDKKRQLCKVLSLDLYAYSGTGEVT